MMPAAHQVPEPSAVEQPSRRRLVWVGSMGDAWLSLSRVARLLDCEPVATGSLAMARREVQNSRPRMVLVHWKLVTPGGPGPRTQLGLSGVPLALVVDRDAPAEVLEAAERDGVEDCLVAPVRAYEVAARLAALAGERPAPEARVVERHSPRLLLVLGPGGIRGGGGLGSLLESCGHLLLYASTLEGGVARVAEGGVTPHLVLLCEDDVPPGALARLRAGLRAQPGLARVPVVLLTSNTVGCEEGSDGVVRLSLRALRPAALLAHLHAMLGRELAHLRMEERVSFCCPLEFRASGPRAGEWVSGFSAGVSPGSLLVRTWVPAKAGAAVSLRIHLPTTRDVLEAEGVVAWAHPYAPRGPLSYPRGMGVQFLGMGSQRLMHLRQLCRATE
ncbi:PilZ domain-containing protein [Myxococcaceae bacterium JPH2]|nr:PilZ domain-containing protein [Myxococcaceae bacterium JPH2]